MARKISISAVILAVTVFFVGCNKDNDIPITGTFTYDFSTSQDGWIGGFSDHHDTSTAEYNLIFSRTNLPAPLNTSKQALKLGGTNRSDDLFMFIKRKITGLNPNKTYKIKFDVEFASNVPTNQIGVGGAPDAVMMKAGATLYEPLSIWDAAISTFRMNINQGQQFAEGTDMNNLGTIGVNDSTTQYSLLTKNNSAKLFTITTNASGEVWVIIGTDSGYEARTELYYNKITLTFN